MKKAFTDKKHSISVKTFVNEKKEIVEVLLYLDDDYIDFTERLYLVDEIRRGIYTELITYGYTAAKDLFDYEKQHYEQIIKGAYEETR